MMSVLRSFVRAWLVLAACSLSAQEGKETSPEAGKAEAGEQQPEMSAEEQVARYLAQFHPTTGTVEVGDVGQVALPDGWQWLARRDGQEFLVTQGNHADPAVLGVAIAPDFVQTGIFTVYTHSDEGHVKDDAPDFDEVLATMQEDVRASNEARRRAGVPTVELIGWAEPPHIDKASNKIYYAKELQFEGHPVRTLNYVVYVLGRSGYIEINGVGNIEQLPLVDAHCKSLLGATEFVDGKRYSDFDPEYDKVAAYGIGGLIAGKLALKAGLFAKLGILLLKFLKPILVGVAVLGGLLFKLLGARRKAEPEVRPVADE
ncbi:MAG TPA: DUF2167 domain-containing protein [bacterium]|nr:DUF2167 domain-containing protein [bacterium]